MQSHVRQFLLAGWCDYVQGVSPKTTRRPVWRGSDDFRLLWEAETIMYDAQTTLKTAIENAIRKYDGEEAAELQAMIAYYTRIRSAPRRALMRSVMREALYHDMGNRESGPELDTQEAAELRTRIMEAEKAERENRDPRETPVTEKLMSAPSMEGLGKNAA